jgi:hypothetical protein
MTIKFSNKETTAITAVAEHYLKSPVGKEVLMLLMDEVNAINKEDNLPERTYDSVSFKFYETRKRILKVISPENTSENITKEKISERLIANKKSLACKLLSQLKDTFISMETELLAEKQKNKDLLSQLRELRDVRQAVENYQKKRN